MEQFEAVSSILNEHVAVPTREDDGHLRVQASYFLRQLDAAHARHDDVGKDDMIPVAIRSQRVEGLCGVEYSDAVKTQFLECFYGEVADLLVVFNDQYAVAGTADQFISHDVTCSDACFRTSSGQIESERRTVIDDAAHANIATRLLRKSEYLR